MNWRSGDVQNYLPFIFLKQKHAEDDGTGRKQQWMDAIKVALVGAVAVLLLFDYCTRGLLLKAMKIARCAELSGWVGRASGHVSDGR